MAIRDLGYKPYEGTRNPASHNTLVMLRHGLRRAWGSWLVKIAAFTGWVPALVGIGIVGFAYWFSRQAGLGQLSATDAAKAVRTMFSVQVWLFLSMITLGAGAGAIAEDLGQKAFQFYFAKPVTIGQYLLGRMAAVGVYAFLITVLPASALVMMLVGTAPKEALLERAGLLLPTVLFGLVIAVVAATCSVGVSSLSRSRALTMSAWVLLFVVPHVIAKVVALIGSFPWLYLASLPELLGRVGDAFFKIDPTDALRWYYAAPVLALLAAGFTTLAYERLKRAEVIA